MGMASPHIEKEKHQRYETGLDVEPPGQAKEGRPKNTWRRDLEADITQTGLSWKQLERIARTGYVGEMLCMAYAPGGAKGLSK